MREVDLENLVNEVKIKCSQRNRYKQLCFIVLNKRSECVMKKKIRDKSPCILIPRKNLKEQSQEMILNNTLNLSPKMIHTKSYQVPINKSKIHRSNVKSKIKNKIQIDVDNLDGLKHMFHLNTNFSNQKIKNTIKLDMDTSEVLLKQSRPFGVHCSNKKINSKKLKLDSLHYNDIDYQKQNRQMLKESFQCKSLNKKFYKKGNNTPEWMYIPKKLFPVLKGKYIPK